MVVLNFPGQPVSGTRTGGGVCSLIPPGRDVRRAGDACGPAASDLETMKKGNPRGELPGNFKDAGCENMGGKCI